MRGLAGGIFGSGSFSNRDIGGGAHLVFTRMLLVIASFLIPSFAQRTRKGWGTRGWGTRGIVGSYVAVVFGWAAFLIFRLGIFHARRDDDFHGQLFIDRRDKVTAAAIVKDADDRFLFS